MVDVIPVPNVTAKYTTEDGKPSPEFHRYLITLTAALREALAALAVPDGPQPPPLAHTHAIADVTGLADALAALTATKADLVHAHVAADVTDFDEAVDDRVAVFLVAGTAITIVYDDGAGTLTISTP